MALISGHDLIAAGWLPGPGLGTALEKAAELEAKGIHDADYIIKLLLRDCPPEVLVPKLKPREEALAFGEAIDATSALEVENVGNVRRLMRQLMKMPVVTQGAIMPDACPAGNAEATIPVGGAVAVQNAIIPSAHSADICCSMYATFFHCEKGTTAMLDDLMASTRFGGGGRAPEDQVPHDVIHEDVWENPFLQGLERYAAAHMADQGDGNHFAYLGKFSANDQACAALKKAGHTELADALQANGDCLVLVTHHGSRGLGAAVYGRGQKAAMKHTAEVAEGIPPAAAWLDYQTEEGQAYWDALQYVARWTKANHQSIHARFLERAAAQRVAEFGNEHNFVWKRGDLFYHGKGATPAWKDDAGRPLLGLIPLNMAAPILMVLGSDNADYLSFAPHGAGRNQSRTATMRRFGGDEAKMERALKESTDGIEVRWFSGKSDLSESPLGYKSAEQIAEQIQRFGLADVIATIQPLGSIMAGDQGPPPWIRRKQELTPKQLRAIEHRAERRKTRQSFKGQNAFEDEED
jgi:tRNA-splicing ligase RtcB (3'-phosphate/5'-hydroxy nucleic acid ligase)